MNYFLVEGGGLLAGEDDPRKPRVPVVFVECLFENQPEPLFCRAKYFFDFADEIAR